MRVYSYQYDLSYNPAAPQLSVLLLPVGITTGGITLDAIIDSGADATMIPTDVLKDMGLEHSNFRYMQGITGHRIQVPIYDIAIEIGEFTFPAVSVVAAEVGGDLLIGRDVLNHLSVRLDGPAQVVEVSE